MKRVIKIIMICLLIATTSSCNEQGRKSWVVKEGVAITMDGDTLHFVGGTITMWVHNHNKYRDINNILLNEDYKKIKED